MMLIDLSSVQRYSGYEKNKAYIHVYSQTKVQLIIEDCIAAIPSLSELDYLATSLQYKSNEALLQDSTPWKDRVIAG